MVGDDQATEQNTNNHVSLKDQHLLRAVNTSHKHHVLGRARLVGSVRGETPQSYGLHQIG